MHRVSAINTTGWVPPDDKRVLRACVDLPVSFNRPDQAPQQGRLTLLSSSGVFVETPATLPIGATLQLEFHLPTNQSIRCSAMIRSTRSGRGAGMAFLNLSPTSVAAIDAFLEGLW